VIQILVFPHFLVLLEDQLVQLVLYSLVFLLDL
jgi:hypothetical protein